MSKALQSVAVVVLIAISLHSRTAYSQNLTIRGQVKSTEDNLGLPGVNVLEKGTTNGTVTDADGNYSIVLSNSSSVLVFSFVGFATQEVPVGTETVISPVLTPDVSTLEEVVVIGYDEVRKSDATGSVALVTAKSFNKGVVNSPQELIAGKAAGVVVTSNSGAPGNTSTIRIRGGASLNASNDPLIVIDGVPVSNTNLGGTPNTLAILNPNDIASVSILKDASATAIYGLRASNGVIIITTKRGSDALSVSYNATGTVYTIPKKVDVLTGDEFRDLINEQYEGNNAVLSLLSDENTDWQEAIYQQAYGQDHNVNLTGRAFKNTPFRIGAGYNNTDGILKTYNFERISLSLSADPTFLNDALKLSFNVKGMVNNNNFADQAAIGDAVRYDPTKPVLNGNSRWRGYTTWTTGGINGNGIPLATANPVARLALTDNTSVVNRSIGNFKVDYALPFVENLHAVLNVGYDYTTTDGHNNVLDSTQWITDPTPDGGRVNPYQSKSKNDLLDFYLNYNRDLKSIQSKIELLGGYSYAKFHNEGSSFTSNQSLEDTVRADDYRTRYVLLSFFGRLNYTYKERYLLTATLRDDASSRISKTERHGLFPALALAWKIHSESFLRNSKTVSDLKLRLGYGQTGQQDLYGSDYPFIPTYTRSNVSARYQFGDQFYYTLRPDAYDVNFKWETTSTINAGLDFGFLQNAISGSVDVFHKVSSDLIADVPIPVGTNFRSRLVTNVGEMENKGVELTVNADIFSRNDFEWSVGYNVAYLENKINYLNLSKDPDYFVKVGGIGGTTAGEIQVHKIGYSPYAFYPYQQVYGQDGRPMQDVYVDRNDDGIINSDDLYVYKQRQPKWTMGFNSRIVYHNFDFNFNARASIGNHVYNNIASGSTYVSLYDSKGFLSNVPRYAKDTEFTQAFNTRFSDYYIENASFFRMDNINAGYTFREVYKEKLNIRVGAGVQNAFVINGYSGIDPEVESGLDNNFFPRTRSFFLNVNFEF